MERIRIYLFILSLVCSVLALTGSIWLLNVAPDGMVYAMVVIFAFSTVWLGFNVWRSWRK